MTENLTGGLTAVLDRGAPMTGRLPLPAWLAPRPNPGKAELLEFLIEAGASNAYLRIFGYLGRACQRHEAPYFWERSSTIATILGLSPGTISEALQWFESIGMAGRSKEIIKGRVRDVIWCLWLFDPRTRRASEVEPSPRQPDVHYFEAPVLQNNESKDCIGSCSPENLKTTTDGGTLSSFSEAQEDGIQDPDPEPSRLDPELLPAIADAQAVATELVAAIVEATHRERVQAKLTTEATAWLPRVEPLWIKLAILEYGAKIRLKNDPNPIISPVKWFRGMLETWEENGEASPRLARAALEAAAAEERRAKQAQVDRIAAEAKRVEEAAVAEKEARIEAAWERLDEAGRNSIEAEARTRYPFYFRRESRPFQHRQACLMVLGDRKEIDP